MTLTALAFILALAPFAFATGPALDSTAAPAHEHQWAAPIDKPGLPNLHKVSDALFRGAQPTAEGMKQLQAMGIKTIAALTIANADGKLVESTGLRVVHISCKPWHAEDECVVQFLALAADKDNQPVYVHCQHGSDRTGLMVAMYRIAIQGWSKDEAIAEMTRGDFGFHSVWKNLVAYIRHVNIDDLKRRAGLGK